jgi:hypothetical protein
VKILPGNSCTGKAIKRKLTKVNRPAQKISERFAMDLKHSLSRLASNDATIKDNLAFIWYGRKTRGWTRADLNRLHHAMAQQSIIYKGNLAYSSNHFNSLLDGVFPDFRGGAVCGFSPDREDHDSGLFDQSQSGNRLAPNHHAIRMNRI